MKKKFITNLAFLLGLNFLIKPFWIFGIDRTVQNLVGADGYGTYYALFNFTFLFNILLDLGITNFNNRNISQNNQLLSKHISGIILLRVFLTIIYLLISLVVARAIGYSFHEFKLLLFMLFNQVLISFILYLRSNLAGLQFFKTDSFISILDRLLMIIICGILLWSGITKSSFKIEWFVWAQTTAYATTALCAYLILSRKSEGLKLSWNLPFFIMILKQSYPYAILILLMTFSYRIDSVMLERLLSDGALQAGIYAQAYRLLDAAAMIAYLFAALLLPMYAKMLKNKENIEELTRLSFALIIIPAVIAAAAGLFYNKQIMSLLYHSHTEESAIVFSLLMICFIGFSSSYIFGTLLTANGSLTYLNYTALAGMILNICLNFWLIPEYKVTGAAISCLITQTFTAAAQVFIVRKVFHFKINLPFIRRLLIFSLISLLLCWFGSQVKFDWIYSLILAVTGCLLIAFLLKIVSLKDLYFIDLKKT